MKNTISTPAPIVTQLLNEVYKSEDSGLDSDIQQLQYNSLNFEDLMPHSYKEALSIK